MCVIMLTIQLSMLVTWILKALLLDWSGPFYRMVRIELYDAESR